MKIIHVITSKKPYATSQIFEKREGRTHTEYRYNPQNDITRQRLNEFVIQYKKEDTIDNKKKILETEKQILLEELENPELGIVRLDKTILSKLKKGINKQKLFDWLKLCAINGYYRIITLPDKLKPKSADGDYQILKEAFINTNEDASKYNFLTKLLIIRALDWEGKVNIVRNFINKAELLKNIYDRTFDIDKISEKIRTGRFNNEDFKIFLNHNFKDKKEEQFAKSVIIKILKDKTASPKLKQLAVWGAGKYKSESAYKIIKKIAKNKSERDIILREYALHSVAFYVRQHSAEVKKILVQVANEASIFSPFAKILKSKLDGKYHSTRNKPFIDKNMGKKDVEEFEKIKRKVTDEKIPALNIMNENKIDESLLEILNPLKKLIKMKFKIFISDETGTKIFKSLVGKRYMNDISDNNQGDFEDTTTGFAKYDSNPCILISTTSLNRQYFSVMKHELAHQLQQHLLTAQENGELKKIYEEAHAKKLPLGRYAATNEREYFACAMDAFLSPYIAHENLLYYGNSKYQLMVKDRKMYDFLQKIYDKYCRF